jgi:hypothetical protein
VGPEGVNMAHQLAFAARVGPCVYNKSDNPTDSRLERGWGLRMYIWPTGSHL